DLFGVADADDDPLTRGGLPPWPHRRHPALVRAARVRCGSRARWEKWSERYEVSRRRRRRLSGCGDCRNHRDENECGTGEAHFGYLLFLASKQIYGASGETSTAGLVVSRVWPLPSGFIE